MGRVIIHGALGLLLLGVTACSDDSKPPQDGGLDGVGGDMVTDGTGPQGVEVLFAPLGSPAQAPLPNDLFVDPATGLVNLPLPDAAKQPAEAYRVKHANTLDGFSQWVTPEAELTGKLKAASVTKDAVKVLDISDPSSPVAVDNLTFEYKEVTDTAGSTHYLVRVWNPAGWTRGASYAVVLLAGAKGLQDRAGQAVARSQRFDQVLSTAALCEWDATKSWDSTSNSCTAPGSGQTATGCCTKTSSTTLDLEQATILERLRRGYDKLITAASGITRADVVGIWSFPVVSMNQAVFNIQSSTPTIPLPSDLLRDPQSGMLNVPDLPGDSAAQKEFNVYLNSLDGWPANLPSVLPFFADLDSSTADKGLKVYEVTTGTTPTLTEVTGVTVSWDAAQHSLTASSATPLTHGSTYLMVGVAGDQALKNADTTLASLPKRTAQMNLALSPQPLCTYDSSAKACTDVKVSSFIDDPNLSSGGKTAIEHATAMEQLRRVYDGLLKVLDTKGVKREDVVVMSTFTVTSMTEMLYDPGAGVLPFPNNLLMNQTTGLVDIPAQPGETPAEAALRQGLNTLDGFTTQGAYFAPISGKVDSASLQPFSGTLAADVSGIPVAMTFAVDPAGAITAKPDKPLAENANFGVVLMSKLKPGDLKPEGGSGVTDDQGRRVIPSLFMALLRSKNPLYDATAKKSLVRVLDDATAEQVETARVAHKPLFDKLEALLQVKRQDIVLGWTFKTQSITDTATKLRALPWSVLGALDSNQPKLSGAVDTTLANYPTVLFNHAVTKANIAGWVAHGTFQTWIALDQAGTGALLPDPTQGKPGTVTYLLTIPKGTMPANGWPLVIYQHGYTSYKEFALYFSDMLAKEGFAVLSFDMIYHGERSWCTQDSHCTASGTCDVTTGKCSTALAPAPNGDGEPAANGAKFLDINNPNPFAARDNFRQHLIDSEALFRAISLGGASGLTGATVKFDPTQVHYLARSMGGITGVEVLATSSLPKRVVLNAVGAPLVDIFATAPHWKSLWDTFLAAFNVQPGTLGYLKTLVTFNWIMDAVDPGNFAKYLTQAQLDDLVNTGKKVPKKEVLFQYAGADTFVPPDTCKYLSTAGTFSTTKTTYPGCDHRFLWFAHPVGTENSTLAAQKQMINFFKTGTVCTPDTTAGTCN